ncbi:MAG: hypothetical protein N2235_09625 [Fischerella sp.]|nr:hypothetical protein [Fischerella sp.]
MDLDWIWMLQVGKKPYFDQPRGMERFRQHGVKFIPMIKCDRLMILTEG